MKIYILLITISTFTTNLYSADLDEPLGHKAALLKRQRDFLSKAEDIIEQDPELPKRLKKKVMESAAEIILGGISNPIDNIKVKHAIKAQSEGMIARFSLPRSATSPAFRILKFQLAPLPASESPLQAPERNTSAAEAPSMLP